MYDSNLMLSVCAYFFIYLFDSERIDVHILLTIGFNVVLSSFQIYSVS